MDEILRNNCTNGSTFDQQTLFPGWLHYTEASITVLIAVFSIVGNVLIIIILKSLTKYNKIIKIYRIQLAISHLISTVITYWMFIASSLHGKWIFRKAGLCAIFSILIFAAIALNRACTLKQVKSVPLREAVKNSIILWIIAFALTSPPVFGWNEYVIVGLGTTCCFDLHSNNFGSRSFIIYILICGFIIPLAVIFLSYRRVCVVLLESATLRMQSLRGPRPEVIEMDELLDQTCAPTQESPTQLPQSQLDTDLSQLNKLKIVWRDQNNFQNQIRPMKTMLVVTICFIFAWTPYAILAVVEQFLYMPTISPYLVAAAGMAAKSYVTFDPVVYVLTDSTFRKRFMQIFTRADNFI